MTTALITGASRGLGRAAALHLAQDGIDVVGTYRSSEAEAGAVAAEIRSAGARAVMLRYDAEATDAEAFATELKGALAELGAERLDHLVNNAGVGAHAPFADTDLDVMDRMYRIHVRAPYALTRAVLPMMADGGRILFVSSGLARFAIPGYGAYAAMKGAVEVLTRYGAAELGARGIRVNTIAPGAIATDFGGGAVRDNEEVRGFVSSTIALGRPGEADDIGGAVAAILSDRMGWLNGERIEVSGGQSI
ncbi:SDR family NAD(P)-dependent oxidoreductase [uncultured Jannaschia sp.]|uniref:SDR family NAD(P)-dependent oxidoreductase n=1 Tax=uncultured Jannaschia sp. TaxID=293347 RepID=UPI0026268E00|nr:SDR family oxidoreductase [uncultured Jannaschia sp.]